MPVILKSFVKKPDSVEYFSDQNSYNNGDEPSEIIEQKLMDESILLSRTFYIVDTNTREVTYSFNDMDSCLQYILLLLNDTDQVIERLNDMKYKNENNITQTWSIEQN